MSAVETAELKDQVAGMLLGSIIGAEYIEPRQLAADLTVSKRTLDRWHAQRIGPPRVVVGRTVLYRRSSVIAWLQAREETQPRRRKAGRLEPR